MINNLGLSFGLLIALFVPGFILLSALLINVYGINFLSGSNIKDMMPTLKESHIFIMFIITIISLTLGLLLDGIRYVVTWIIQVLVKSEIDTSIFKEEDRKYYDWVVEHNFRFHQFYSNICLALLISALMLNGTLHFGILWPAYFFSIICLISAVLSYKKALDSLNDRITLIKKGEAQ